MEYAMYALIQERIETADGLGEETLVPIDAAVAGQSVAMGQSAVTEKIRRLYHFSFFIPKSVEYYSFWIDIIQ